MGNDKGNFKADISDDAIAAALASVSGAKPASAPAAAIEEEVGGVTIEVEGGGTGGDASPGEEVEAGDPATAAKIRQLEAMLEDSMGRAKQTADRLKETHERYVRLAADFDNHKKRQSKEREDTLKFATEKLVKDLLPVIDNLERALAAEGDVDAVKKGVKLVANQFLSALAKAGVQGFDSVGVPFDPSKHEALMQAESTVHPAGVVVQEFVRGYMLADRVARPAAVVVSKGPGPGATPPADPAQA